MAPPGKHFFLIAASHLLEQTIAALQPDRQSGTPWGPWPTHKAVQGQHLIFSAGSVALAVIPSLIDKVSELSVQYLIKAATHRDKIWLRWLQTISFSQVYSLALRLVTRLNTRWAQLWLPFNTPQATIDGWEIKMSAEGPWTMVAARNLSVDEETAVMTSGEQTTTNNKNE